MTITTDVFSEAAWRIGSQLTRTAFNDGKRCNWVGNWMEPVDGEYKTVSRSFGPDLYSGTSGIALFLAALYAETGDALLLNTLESTVNQVISTMHQVPDFGFYSGKAGISAALVRIGELSGRKDWQQEGIALAEGLKVRTLTAGETDLISGAAGTIPLLTQLARDHHSEQCLETAVGLGRELIRSAMHSGESCSWITLPGNPPLTGFSHGAAGISYALLALYEATGDRSFLETALAGIRFEQELYNGQEQNWPDLRTIVKKGGSYSCAWCHGAPGIGLSRMKMKQYLPDGAQQEQAALQTTARQLRTFLSSPQSPHNFSLCHGLAGNADILLESGDPVFVKLASEIGSFGMERYHHQRQSWPSGLSTTAETPGLLMGLAGTGYFYLRLANAEKFGSVLLPGLLR
ncbi:MAG: lanthionine synthetase LanC family protein [Bacteroidota bacterium]